MARVTSDEVKKIIDIDSSITDLSPFITIANLLVTDKLAGSGQSEDLLKEIERWLAAHFVAIRDPRAKSESIGGISITYAGNTGEGFRSTLYGQTALSLDTTGILAKLGSKQASIGVVEFDS